MTLFPWTVSPLIDTDAIRGLRTEHHVLTIGVGVIGIEYACIAAASDIPVTLIERHPRILDFVDQQIVEALSYHMRSQGVTFRLGEEVEEVTKSSEGKVCARLKADSGRLTRATHVNCCNQAWPLKNSISQNRSKKLCVRRPYKRISWFSWT
jgi:pyruvate/2-oxoglutarate dehydrogenase complex dihydrolipoamide dehydrogenase (E3) component